MNIELSLHETRIIGCLIEKATTTPDQYPLSLNALTNACNQKSNRDPVLELDEATVQSLLDRLIARFLVTEQRGYGSRVSKFEHRLCNTSFGTLNFSPQELAIVCELFLRGPQTPGELRSRASRMAPFTDVGEVEKVLENLAARKDGPFVVRLAREPGKRESRYAHLFSGEAAVPVQERPSALAEAAPEQPGRMVELEERIASLEAEVAELKSLISELARP
jgi:uncharacterized protein